MADPHKLVSDKMTGKAQELNNSPTSKAMKDSLPFVLASMTMQSLTEGAKAIKEAATSVIDQAKEITNTAKATLFKQVNGDYGVSTHKTGIKDVSTNEMKTNEARANEVNPNEARTYQGNPNEARTNVASLNQPSAMEATIAENSFGDFSDKVKDNPLPIEAASYWTPPEKRESMQQWCEAIKTMGKEGLNAAKEGMKELGGAVGSLTKQHVDAERTY